MIVAVVIPYFQRREGILRRALQSILAQQLPAEARVEIVVVDDGSPIPAESEASALPFQHPYHLTVIRQSNAGVSAARNAALARLPPETDYVAFLDSDDIWHPEHLATALTSLDEHGYDFYFCDAQRTSEPQTSFEEKRFADYVGSNGEELMAGIWELPKEPFLERVIRARMFLTPTVVYRRSVAPDMRFDTALRVAGEDCLFLFGLIGLCRRVCCSMRRLVTCADGINIHAGKYNWDDPNHLILTWEHHDFPPHSAATPALCRERTHCGVA